MVKISIVQGRLSTPVGSRFQHFPIHAWRQEFEKAAQIGFDGMEWIVSDFSNPLFDPENLLEAAELSRHHKIQVTSVSLDIFMYLPARQLPWEDVTWLMDKLSQAIQILGTPRVSIPIEETSGIRTPQEAKETLAILRRLMDRYQNQILLPCIETDLSPRNVQQLLSQPGLERLGLLLDIGNLTANGYRLQDFMALCPSRIYGLHIKDRPGFFGPSCPLGEGEVELQKALSQAPNLPNLSDITLQAFRSSDRFLEDATHALRFVKNAMGIGVVL